MRDDDNLRVWIPHLKMWTDALYRQGRIGLGSTFETENGRLIITLMSNTGRPFVREIRPSINSFEDECVKLLRDALREWDGKLI